MKLIIKTILSISLLSTALVAHADTIYGKCIFGKVVLDDLTCFGPASLNDTKIKGSLNVYGPLDAENVEVNDIDVKGIIHINHSTVKGSTSVYGPVFATNTVFMNDVYSDTSFFQLIDSSINGNLTIHDQSDQPTLQMMGTSYIKKNLIFSGTKGKVDSKGTSKVEGNVENG